MSVKTELATKIGEELVSASERTIVRRLGAALQRPFLRLARSVGGEEAVIAMDEYLRAVRRAEFHIDDAANGELERTAGELEKFLKNRPDAEAALLKREIAFRRRVIIEQKEVLEKETREAAQRSAIRVAKAGLPDASELGAALVQRNFLDRLRFTIRTLKSGVKLAGEDLTLLRAYRKMRSVIGADWTAGWEEVFRYAREHAPSIGAAERRYQAAVDALEAAKKAGSPAAINAAEQEVKSAAKSRAGFLSKIKGILGEAYASRWQDWLVQRNSFMSVAEGAAEKLGPKWKVRHVVGNLFLDNAEAWDEAILLVSDGPPPEARVFLAAQFKVEREISALEQIERDALRETGGESAAALPKLTVPREGMPGAFDGYTLKPMSPGEASYRYVFNAVGGRLSAADIALMERLGVQVNQMTMDVSLPEFDSVASAISDAVAKSVH